MSQNKNNNLELFLKPPSASTYHQSLEIHILFSVGGFIIKSIKEGSSKNKPLPALLKMVQTADHYQAVTKIEIMASWACLFRIESG